jgi:purine-binding chemotaxis protein CheW
MNLVSFDVRGQRLGCPIAQVKETIVVRPMTRVFLTPSWVAGIINLRGDVVAVLDLAVLLGLGPTVPQPGTRIVIVQSGERTAGVLVDRLAEARTVDLDRLEAPPATLAPEVAALLSGIATLADGAPLAILDLDKLFESDRVRELGRRT